MENQREANAQDRVAAAIEDVELIRSDRATDGRKLDAVSRSDGVTIEGSIGDGGRPRSVGPAGPVHISTVDVDAFPEVTVRFRVVTADGISRDLGADDVAVYEDGALTESTVVAPAESRADVVFVFDDLGSMLEAVIGAPDAIAGVVDELASAGVDARYAIVAAR